MNRAAIALIGLLCAGVSAFAAQTPRRTSVTISGGKFLINGAPTVAGRTWRGYSVEGLLPNARLVQGIFDDLNPETRTRWAYPDTGRWDPERNTNEFVAAMPAWREHGLLAFTLNLQGGSPMGYGNQGWINSAFAADGALRPDYFARLEHILDRADDLGMVVILGLFYFGQDQVLRDETAVFRATDDTLAWLHARGYRNLVIEACNETNERGYDHEILRPAGINRLLARIRDTKHEGFAFPAAVSLGGCTLPSDAIVAASDVILLHGNNRAGQATTPAIIRDLVAKTRALPSYRGQPIVFNEDDHYDFAQPDNDFFAATEVGASWGYFDYRRRGEPFADGYQSVPADWTISSDRKERFFATVETIFGR